MRIITKNRIFKEERYWELISGPWTVAEDWLMQQHINDFKRSGIDCTTETVGDLIYVYRCAKGYINLNKKIYQSSAPHRPDYNGVGYQKPKISEFRKLQEERQRDLQRALCEK